MFSLAHKIIVSNIVFKFVQKKKICIVIVLTSQLYVINLLPRLIVLLMKKLTFTQFVYIDLNNII